MPALSFRNLRVWQEVMKLTTEIYRGTADFPKHELYGLTSQIRRAAASVPATSRKAKAIARTKSLYDSCSTRVGRFWSFTPS
jgi:four helix bundle protein